MSLLKHIDLERITTDLTSQMVTAIILLRRDSTSWTLLRVCPQVSLRCSLVLVPCFCFSLIGCILLACFSHMPYCVTLNTCPPSTVPAKDVTVFGKVFLTRRTIWHTTALKMGIIQARFKQHSVIPRLIISNLCLKRFIVIAITYLWKTSLLAWLRISR